MDIVEMRKCSSILIAVIGIALLAFVICNLFEVTDGTNDNYENWCEYYQVSIESNPVRCYDNFVYEQTVGLDKCYHLLVEVHATKSTVKKKRILNEMTKTLEDLNDKSNAYLSVVTNNKELLDAVSEDLYQNSLDKIKEFSGEMFRLIVDVDNIKRSL